uniref:Uncharacterized protein n=1 Tax=Cacopsylla melanoneura TaxID=428564 RepID=A0A8D9BDS4_9HEMI
MTCHHRYKLHQSRTLIPFAALTVVLRPRPSLNLDTTSFPLLLFVLIFTFFPPYFCFLCSFFIFHFSYLNCAKWKVFPNFHTLVPISSIFAYLNNGFDFYSFFHFSHYPFLFLQLFQVFPPLVLCTLTTYLFTYFTAITYTILFVSAYPFIFLIYG